MSFLDKAKELAGQAKGKAEELAEKAGPNAAKGLDAAKSSLDKATGGKYHDQIESVSGKVEGVLKRDSDSGGSGSGNPGNGDSAAKDDPGTGSNGSQNKGPDDPAGGSKPS
ncbi:antitoxin [Saccharopolyspora flava]|uniref:MT0933-like antitoxin protein n=1 Tax=Saccharopolyspora flava TaxID=95161 RepID=A0A1I6QS80_9PSEU|nr:antitoxin [Saccharopolyspora flava]SFS55377.1 MT0933-like antitoxin protein [Saccharopolyspora flava]